jgi:hypothetical protein
MPELSLYRAVQFYEATSVAKEIIRLFKGGKRIEREMVSELIIRGRVDRGDVQIVQAKKQAQGLYDLPDLLEARQSVLDKSGLYISRERDNPSKEEFEEILGYRAFLTRFAADFFPGRIFLRNARHTPSSAFSPNKKRLSQQRKKTKNMSVSHQGSMSPFVSGGAKARPGNILSLSLVFTGKPARLTEKT